MSSSENIPLHQSVLFRTPKGMVIQNDLTNCFILEFSGKKAEFNVQDFLQFKKSIDRISLEDLFLNENGQPDIQIIHHKNSDHIFVLTLCELVAIKELLNGAKAMLDLNSIICSRLYRCVL